MKEKRYITYGSLNKRLAEYNCVISLKQYCFIILTWITAVFLACYIYRIKLLLTFAIIIIGLLMIPGLLYEHVRQRAEMKRFADVDVYLHQMAYSFMRVPKINQALRDSQTISEGKLKTVIGRALDEMSYGMGERVYEDALSIIEEEYNCKRVGVLHRFMIGVEEKGGKYTGSLNILIEDFNRWVANVYKYHAEIGKIKRDINIGLIISMVLAALTTIMCGMLDTFATSSVSITESPVYQGAACLFILLCMAFFNYCQKHYKYDFFGEQRSDEEIMKQYSLVYESKAVLMTVKMIPVWTVLTVLSVLLASFVNIVAGLSLFMVMIILIISPFASRNLARKKVHSDLYSGFTEWLRNLAISMDDKPLLAAIEDTYEDCPVIMKNQLGEFIEQIENNPKDIVPYYTFLSEFGIIDIQAAVRTLYSIGELDKDDMRDTIDALVSRNNAMSDKAEAAKHLDNTSLMRFSEYVPTFFVAMKMAVDMMLVVSMYL